ncbi:MAG: Uma2 family endonuclease [Acidobacteriaceae bacterium]|nr:Uma2 family endonuclease [Acidobacteriaceae bacterium]
MGAAVQGLPQKLTADEYSKLQEVLGFKDELIEGERVFSPLAKFQHGVVIDNLESVLKGQFSDMVVVREIGWQFRSIEGLDSVPGPDLMVIPKDDYLRAARSSGYFEGRPHFVIEVISPSERKPRRLQKVGLYLEAGTDAVVEVDYTKRRVVIHRPEREIAEVVKDFIIWPFNAELADIFRNLD